ncbi:hypothetical protein, partial [Erwinia amylovora]
SLCHYTMTPIAKLFVNELLLPEEISILNESVKNISFIPSNRSAVIEIENITSEILSEIIRELK